MKIYQLVILCVLCVVVGSVRYYLWTYYIPTDETPIVRTKIMMTAHWKESDDLFITFFLYEIHLRFDGNTQFIMTFFLYLSCKIEYVLSGRSAIIHDTECLIFPASYLAFTISAKSENMIKDPTGWHLVVVANRKWFYFQLWFPRTHPFRKIFVFLICEHDIFEETSGCSYFSRIGKFPSSDICNDIGDIMRWRISDAMLIECFLYITIVDDRGVGIAIIVLQTESYVSDEETVLQCMFENTVAIAKMAILMWYSLICSCVQIYPSYIHYCMTDIHTVCSYVLNRGSSDITRDAYQIFYPI